MNVDDMLPAELFKLAEAINRRLATADPEPKSDSNLWIGWARRRSARLDVLAQIAALHTKDAAR